jgi:hypothetical protein
MNSLEQKYACQESKFLTTLGTTIYVASRTEKTKDCSDTFCGERGSFVNPSLCLGEAFDLAESKSTGKDIKFAIEILTKDIVGSEVVSVVSVPTNVVSITGVASRTNISGLTNLILNSSVIFQNLEASKTLLTLKPDPTSTESNIQDIAVVEYQVQNSQFGGLTASIHERAAVNLILRKVALGAYVAQVEIRKPILADFEIDVADGSTFTVDWDNGRWAAQGSNSITVGKSATFNLKMNKVNAILSGLNIDNRQGGNLNISRSNGEWNYTGEGETVLTGCVECYKKEDKCKYKCPSDPNKCGRSCKVGSTILSDENMEYTASGMIRNLEALGGESVKVIRNNVQYILQKTNNSITVASTNLDSTVYEEASDKFGQSGSEYFKASNATHAIIDRKDCKAAINGQTNALHTYNVSSGSNVKVMDAGADYSFAPNSADQVLHMLVDIASANFAYNSNGTQVNGKRQDQELSVRDTKKPISPTLSQINATGTSRIDWIETNVSKKLDGISDLKAIYTDDTKALHTKKLGDELIENVDGAANDLTVSGKASLKKVFFGSQATMQSSDEFTPKNRIFVKSLTADNGRFAFEAATNTLNVPVGKAFDLSGPNTSLALQGGKLQGDIVLNTQDNQSGEQDSSLQLNNLEHIGDIMLSGSVKGRLSSGITTGHVCARDGAKLEFRNHVHQGSDPLKPLINSMNASEIKKSACTAALQKIQSAIQASGDKPLSVVKDLVKLEVGDDYNGVAYDYTRHTAPVDIAWGNLNAGNVARVLEGNANNRPTVQLAESGTFSKDAAIKNVILNRLETKPKF